MNHLSHTEIWPGNILKTEEGYIELLEPCDEGKTFVRGSHTLISQRWLVRFPYPDQIPGFDIKKNFDQKILAGKKTHRKIIYLSPRKMDTFTLGFEKDSENVMMQEDYNGLF